MAIDPTYMDHARRLDSAAAAEYKKWLEGMTPAERAKLIELGIDAPAPESSHASGHSPSETQDAAESPLAVIGFDYDALDRDPSDPAPRASGLDPLVIQRVIGLLLIEQNVRISVAGLCFALNLDALNGLGSIREYAAQIDVSPEAISKKKRQWEAELGISSTTFGKTTKAKAALSQAQRLKHWRNKTWTSPTPPCPHP
jgi:hypothetical protein